MRELSKRLKILADPARLAILDFLRAPVQSCCSRKDGVCACDLEAYLQLSQPTVSHHMKLLVENGFVTSEKRGRWVYYLLNGTAFEEITAALDTFKRAATAKEAT